MLNNNIAINRLEQIESWLKAQFPSTLFTFEPASSDASFRRYFRITVENKSYILMDAPPEKEDTTSFITIGTFLYQQGINVPEIVSQDAEQGFLLLTDFGSQAYLDKLNLQSVDRLYHLAIDSLIEIQSIDSKALSLPSYDKSLLQQEMDLFPQWYLGEHMAITAPEFLQKTFDLLVSNALVQPQVLVHRDYHSRNLMNTAENSPGIIDFQDAVVGPVTYDLVSLLRDCYIEWPEEKLTEWLQYYLHHAQQKGILNNSISIKEFTRWFDLMGLQRHIKVLGIFCRLNYRDNKANYIDDLPLTLKYVQHVSAKYPEFSDLNDFLTQQSLTGKVQ